MKKFLSLLICVTLIMSNFVIVSAASNGGAVNSTVNWELDNGVLKITGQGELTNSRDSYFSWDSNKIVEIQISEGITRIGRVAFYRCERVQSISLPDSIEKIDDLAFAHCSNLMNIDFPSNLTTIEESAFEGCTQLAEINLPDSVVSIGENAFKNTLWEAMQDDGLVYVGKVLYTYKGDMPQNTKIVLKSDTKGIANDALSFEENIKDIVLPNGLKHIGNDSLRGLMVSFIDIPSTVETIGEGAFGKCKNIEEIKLPNGIKEISNGLFYECSNLKRVNIPPSVTYIQNWAFHESSLESVIIPNSVTRIGEEAFSGTGISDVIIGSNVKIIEENAFTSDNLNGCTYVGSEEQWNNVYVNYGNRMYDTSNDCLIPVKFLNLPNDTSVVSVILNNSYLKFDFPAIIVNGRTLVPLRKIFESMGATVDWNDSTKTVTSKLGSTTIQLTIGSNLLYKNGTAVALDVPAQLINGYTMVPVRAVAEAFGADVDWDGDTQTVYITTKGNTYSVNSVPQITYDGYNANFADFNGMYIDSFTHSTNSNGTENVKFDVYNTQYIYGLVEIYNANGDLTDVAIIDKMSNSTSIKGVLIDDTGSLIRDIWNGTALTYRQESGYSKKTSINIDIPKGGYIKITNDMSESFIASAINLSDMVFAAKSTFSTLSGFNSETSKDFVYELSLKLINETAFAEAIGTPKKFTDKLCKGVGEELYMNSESVGGFLDTVSKNLDEFADGELAELMISTATNCGIGIAEGTFEALAGPAGVALKAMFTITSVTDVLIEMNDGLDCLYQGSISISAN